MLPKLRAILIVRPPLQMASSAHKGFTSSAGLLKRPSMFPCLVLSDGLRLCMADGMSHRRAPVTQSARAADRFGRDLPLGDSCLHTHARPRVPMI